MAEQSRNPVLSRGSASLISLCILATFLCALLPASFHIDVAAGTLNKLQGLWFYQTVLSLYGPMLPDGCDRNTNGDQVDCRSRAAEERAEQLGNFQLFGAAFLAFVYVLRRRRRDLRAPRPGGGA